MDDGPLAFISTPSPHNPSAETRLSFRWQHASNENYTTNYMGPGSRVKSVSSVWFPSYAHDTILRNSYAVDYRSEKRSFLNYFCVECPPLSLSRFFSPTVSWWRARCPKGEDIHTIYVIWRKRCRLIDANRECAPHKKWQRLEYSAWI